MVSVRVRPAVCTAREARLSALRTLWASLHGPFDAVPVPANV
jgi:hypothetical protein